MISHEYPHIICAEVKKANVKVGRTEVTIEVDSIDMVAHRWNPNDMVALVGSHSFTFPGGRVKFSLTHQLPKRARHGLFYPWLG